MRIIRYIVCKALDISLGAQVSTINVVSYCFYYYSCKSFVDYLPWAPYCAGTRDREMKGEDLVPAFKKLTVYTEFLKLAHEIHLNSFLKLSIHLSQNVWVCVIWTSGCFQVVQLCGLNWEPLVQSSSWQMFFGKAQRVSTLWAMRSVETPELCGWSTKAAIDGVNGHDCVPMKLYLQKQKAGHSLLIPDVDYWS